MMTKCGGAWQGRAHSDSEGTDMPGVAQGLWWDDGGPCVVVSQRRWQGQVTGKRQLPSFRSVWTRENEVV